MKSTLSTCTRAHTHTPQKGAQDDLYQYCKFST